MNKCFSFPFTLLLTIKWIVACLQGKQITKRHVLDTGLSINEVTWENKQNSFSSHKHLSPKGNIVGCYFNCIDYERELFFSGLQQSRMALLYIQRYWWNPESHRNYITGAYSKVNGNTKTKQKIDESLSFFPLSQCSIQLFLPNTEHNFLRTRKYFLQCWNDLQARLQ